MPKLLEESTTWSPSACPAANRKQPSQGTKPAFKKAIHTIEVKFHDDNNEILTISTIEINAMEGVSSNMHNEAFTILKISQSEKNQKINPQCKVDTGVQSNVLPIWLLRIITPEKFDDDGNPKPEALKKNEAILSAYGGSISSLAL